jgi:hypothetical protein
MTAEVAAISHQNSLVLPGSFVLWRSDWTKDQQTSNVDEGITGYLTKEAALSK